MVTGAIFNTLEFTANYASEYIAKIGKKKVVPKTIGTAAILPFGPNALYPIWNISLPRR